jgi:hypothetical protein
LGAPVGEEDNRGDGVGYWEIGQPGGDVEGGEGNMLVGIGGLCRVSEVGKPLAEEGVTSAAQVDGDGVVDPYSTETGRPESFGHDGTNIACELANHVRPNAH